MFEVVVRRLAVATALITFVLAGSAAASSLRLRSARCVPAEHCVSDPHQVAPGGKLALRGIGLKRGQLVVFKRKRTSSRAARTITSKLRASRIGLIVTVPPIAMSGRIRVIDRLGRRSNAFGPIRVVKPAPPEPRPNPSGTVLDGTGIWIWYLNKSDGGNLDSIAARAHALGIRTVFIKSGDGASYWDQFSPLIVGGLKQRGVNVCAWQFVYGKVPEQEAAVGAQAVQSGAQCLVIDVIHPRDDQERLLVEPSPESAQHRACLGGVSRADDERKRQAVQRRSGRRRKSRPRACLSDAEYAKCGDQIRPRRAAAASASSKRFSGSITGASWSSQKSSPGQ